MTEAGRAFLHEARAVLLRAEEAVKTARAVATGAHAELHVGYAPSLTLPIPAADIARLSGPVARRAREIA